MYCPTTTYTKVHTLMNSLPEIESFFKTVMGFFKQDESQVQIPVHQPSLEAVQQSLSTLPDLKEYDPTLGVEGMKEANASSNTALEWIDAHLDVIRPLAGFLAIAAVMFGITKMLDIGILKESSANLVKFVAALKAKDYISAQVNSSVDSLFTMGYSLFGKEYFTPAAKKLQLLTMKVNSLYSECVKYTNDLKVDYFGLIRNNTVLKLDIRYQDLNNKYNEIQMNDKSNYNVSQKLAKCLEMIETLNELKVNMVKADNGKQRPSCVWFAGPPGHGKTVMAKKLCADICTVRNCCQYPRTFDDKFHSGYASQAVYFMDDLCQRKDGLDQLEFHGFTSEDAKDVIGAFQGEKGKPFVSQYMIVTSNINYLQDSPTIQNLISFDRRRDYCFYVFNDKLTAYKEKYRSEPTDPQWWKENLPRICMFAFERMEDPASSSAAHINEQSAEYLCDVTYEEILEIVLEHEKFRSERYRLHIENILLKRGEPIKTEKIEYNSEIFDIPSILKRKGKQLEALAHAKNAERAEAPDCRFKFEAVRQDQLPCIQYNGHKVLSCLASALNESPTEYKMSFTDFLIQFPKEESFVLDSMFTDDCLIAYLKECDALSEYLIVRTRAGKTFVNSYNGEHLFNRPIIEDGFFKKYFKTQMNCDEIVEAFPDIKMYFSCENAHWTFGNIVEKITPQATNMRPVSPQIFHKFYSALLLGDSHVGKTYILNQTFKVDEYYRVLFEKDEEYPKGKILWFDDVTASRDRFDCYREQLVRSYEGRGGKIIATGNNDTEIWKSHKQEREMICNRSLVLTITATFKTKLKLRAKGLTLGQFLGDKNFVERGKYLNVTANIKNGDMVFSDIVQRLKHCLKMDMIAKTVFNTDAFVVPMPENFDYIVNIDACSDQFSSAFSLQDFKCFEIYKQDQNGKLVKASMFEVAAHVTGAIGIIGKAKDTFSSNIKQFIAEFNELESGPENFPHVVIKFLDVTFGFISNEGKPTAYLVDENCPMRPRMTANGLVMGGEFVEFDKHNMRYHGVLTRLFGLHGEKPLPSKVETTNELTMRMFDNLPFVKWAKLGCSIFGIAASTASIAALLAPLFYSSVQALPPPPSTPVEMVVLAPPIMPKAVEDDFEDPDFDWQAFIDICQYDEERRSRPPKGYRWEYDPETRTWHLVRIGYFRECRAFIPADPEGIERRSRPPKGYRWEYDPETRTWHLVRIGYYRERKYPEEIENVEAQPAPQVEEKDEVQWATLPTAKPENGDVVVNNLNEFGIFYDDRIYLMKESSNLGTFHGMCLPYNGGWKVPSMTGRSSFQCGERELEHKFIKTRNVDVQGMNLMISKVVPLSHKTKIDLGSVFAYSYAYGIPYDYENKCIWLVATQKLFGPETNVQIPKGVYDFYRRRFPNYLKDMTMDRNEIQEGMHDEQLDVISNKVANNACALYDTTGFILNGLMLKGNIGVTTAHAFDDSLNLKMRMMDKTDNWQVKLLRKSKLGDMALFVVTNKEFPAQADITRFIITEEEFMKVITLRPKGFPLMFVRHDIDGRRITHKPASADAQITNQGKMEGGKLIYNMTLGHIGYSGVTVRGDCGNPVYLIGKSITSKLCGIHRAGANSTSIAIAFTREYIERFMAQSDIAVSLEKKSSRDFTEFTQHKKCVQTGLNLVGRPISTVYTPATTSKYKTGLDIDNSFEPSILSTTDFRNTDHASMLNEGLARYQANEASDECLADIDAAVIAVSDELISIFNSKDLDTRIYTKTEAINTPFKEEYPKAHSIDRSGSAGFPFTQKFPNRRNKGDYLQQNPTNGLWYFDGSEAGQYVSSRIDQMCVDAENNLEIDAIFSAYLKDEVYKLKKIYDVNSRKTRVFFGCPFDYLIAYRKYFGSFLHRIGETFDMHPIKVGINFNSLEGHALYHYFAEVSDHGFDMDYANWDGGVPRAFTEAVPRLINRVYQHCSDDKEWKASHDVARLSLHRAVERALVVSGNRVWRLEGSQVSGNPGTAVENSLINWILTFCVWLRLARIYAPELANYASFKKYVRCGFYGDDFFAAVHPDVQSWFHFNSCKDIVTIYGFKATSAAKSTGEVPNIRPLAELEFLKKSFRNESGYWVGKANLDSIVKQLSWIRYSPPYSPVDSEWPVCSDPALVAQSIDTIFPELALHGREFFDVWCKKIRKAIKGKPIMLNFPSYEECYATLGMPL